MPIRIVLDRTASRPLRTVGRRLVAVLGALLVLVGLVAGAVPLLVVVLVVTSLVVESVDAPSADAELLRTAGLLLAISVVAIIAGLRLARGRRSLVLFLRRFRHLGATEALSYAAAHAVGRRWRVVTLDDASDVSPIGVSRPARGLAGAGALVALVLAVAGLAWMFGGGFEAFLAGLDTTGSAEPGSVGDAIGAVIGQVIVIIVVGALVGTVVLVAAAFFGLVGLFSWGAHRAALRAERARTAVIDHPAQVEPSTRRLIRRTRAVLAPRLVVVRAAHGVWPEAVLSLAAAARVVVVDLSDPSENLLWEIEALRSLGRPLVLVGQADRLGPIVAAGHVPGGPPGLRPPGGEVTARQAAGAVGVPGDVAARVVAALGDDVEVLAYGGSPAQVRRFAKALRAALEDVA